jgi:glucosamine kinase
MTRSSTVAFALDAGGSHTVVRTRDGTGRLHTWRDGSCAIAAVGVDRAYARLQELLGSVYSELSKWGPVRGCVASSSFPVGLEAPAPDALVRAITDLTYPVRVLLVNDVVPLLWAKPVSGHGLIMNSGTGSTVLGCNSGGRILKVGGHEHILSDQGSAYALAREGLRAATRAVDGLGPDTVVVERAEAFYGVGVRQLGRRLAELDRARYEVARFAPDVVASAESGDAVATRIVAVEAESLAQAALVARERLQLGTSPEIGFSGGLLRSSAYFRDLVERGLVLGGLSPSTTVLDSVDATMGFVDVVDGRPSVLEQVGGLHVASC